MLFCANLAQLFKDIPIEERFARAAEAGYQTVDIPAPYDVNVQEIINHLSWNSLRLASLPCPPPNYTGGAPGCPATPGMEARFQRDVKRALLYAKTLKVMHVRLVLPQVEDIENTSILKKNLTWAATQAGAQILTLSDTAVRGGPNADQHHPVRLARLIDEIAAPNLRLVLEAQAITQQGENLVALWPELKPHVGHVNLTADDGVEHAEMAAFLTVLQKARFAGTVTTTAPPVIEEK